MVDLVSTFLLATFTLFTKKAVGSFFEKDSILGEAAKDTSVGLAKSIFSKVKDKFQINVYQTPDNYDLVRAVRMSYLNSALVTCFARLKSLDTGKWDTLILQNLPQNDSASGLTKKLREQFLPTDQTERKEADWIFSACDKLEQNRVNINSWKPTEDFQIAVQKAELFLKPETESLEPLLGNLRGDLSRKLISELAETAYFQAWSVASPKPPENPFAPERRSIFEPPMPGMRNISEPQTPVIQGVDEISTMQSLSKQHRECLPPTLLDWIENGWKETQQTQSAVTPLGLGGKSKSFEWFDIMCAFFAQEIKQNPKVEGIFQTKLLLDLKYRRSDGQICELTVDVFRNELAKSNEIITAKLENIEGEVRNLNLGQSDIKNKVENLLPMVVTVADISQTVKSISQDVKNILQTVETTSQDVKQTAQQLESLPIRMNVEISRTIEAIETSRGEIREGFSKLGSLVARGSAPPSGNRRVIDIEQLKMDLEEIELDVNARFSKLAGQLLKGLKIVKQMPSEEISAKAEREKYLHFLGLVYFLIGKVDDAIAYHQEAMNWAELNLSEQKKIVNLCNIGNVYLEGGDFEKAIDCYQKSIEVLRRNLKPNS